MICWYCFLWVGGRATAGLCSMDPLRLRGRGISASTRATSSSSGTDCASGGSAGCSRVGLRGRVTAPSSESPASSTGVSSPSSSGSGSNSGGGLGRPGRNKSTIRGGDSGRPSRLPPHNFQDLPPALDLLCDLRVAPCCLWAILPWVVNNRQL